jgi:hypothetical protein
MSRLPKLMFVAFFIGTELLFQLGSCALGAPAIGQAVQRALLFNVLFGSAT